MNTREVESTIFARIRGANARSSTQEIETELQALSSSPMASLPRTGLLESFAQNLQCNGASFSLAEHRSAAVLQLSQFVSSRHGNRRVVTGFDPRLAALPWRDGGLLPRFGAALAGDAVAVSFATCGIAETGSLVMHLDRNNPASNNLLAEDQVILLNASDLKPSLDDIWDTQSPLTSPREGENQPRGVMMISGPSSTADIGMQLVWGAHGPGALHIIVLRDEGIN